MFEGITDPYLLHSLWEGVYSYLVLPQLLKRTDEVNVYLDQQARIWEGPEGFTAYRLYVRWYQRIHCCEPSYQLILGLLHRRGKN